LVKQKDLFDFVFQTGRLMAEKIDSQRAFACVCDAGVDRHPRITARLDRPVKLGKIDENINLKSAVANRVWSFFRRFAMLHQRAPELVGKRYLTGSDEAVQILRALRITEQCPRVDLTEHG